MEMKISKLASFDEELQWENGTMKGGRSRCRLEQGIALLRTLT